MQTQRSSRWGYTTVREQIAHIQIHSGDWEHFGNLRSTVAKNTRCHTCQLHFESGLSCSCSKTVSFPNTADEAYHGSKPTWWEQFGFKAEHGHEVLLLTLPVRCSLWGQHTTTSWARLLQTQLQHLLIERNASVLKSSEGLVLTSGGFLQ